MIRNLVAAIFLLALALPAFAMPVPARAAMMDGMTNGASMAMAADCHGMPTKQDKDGHVQQHGCIGCIAPYAPDIRLAKAAPLPFVTSAQLIRKLDGTAPPPSTPPPRP